MLNIHVLAVLSESFIFEIWGALFQTLSSSLRKYFDLTSVSICDALRDLVAFVQFKERGKDPWRSVTFSKVAS